MRIKLLLTIAVLLPTVGCFENIPTETPTAIVTFAEAHGSGDLHFASANSMRLWAHNHKPLAQEIDSMCLAQPQGDATWADTTEGRLCLAVRRQAFYGFADRTRVTR